MLMEIAAEFLMKELIKRLPQDFAIEQIGVFPSFTFNNHFSRIEHCDGSTGELETTFNIYGTQWIKPNEEGYLYQLYACSWEEDIAESNEGSLFVDVRRVKVDSFLAEVEGKEERLYFLEPKDNLSIPFPFKYLKDLKEDGSNIADIVDKTIDLNECLVDAERFERNPVYLSCFATHSEDIPFIIEMAVNKFVRCEKVIFIERDQKVFVFDNETKKLKVTLPAAILSYREENLRSLIIEFLEKNEYPFVDFVDYLDSDLKHIMNSELFETIERVENGTRYFTIRARTEDTCFQSIEIVQDALGVDVRLNTKDCVSSIPGIPPLVSTTRFGIRTETLEQKVTAIKGGFTCMASQVRANLLEQTNLKLLKDETVQQELKRQFALGYGCEEKRVQLSVNLKTGYVSIRTTESVYDQFLIGIKARHLFIGSLKEGNVVDNFMFEAEVKGGFDYLSAYSNKLGYFYLEKEGLVNFLKSIRLFGEARRKSIIEKFKNENVESCFVGSDFVIRTTYEVFAKQNQMTKIILRRNTHGVAVGFCEGPEMVFSTFIRMPTDQNEAVIDVVESLFNQFSENVEESNRLRRVIANECLRLIEEMQERFKNYCGDLPF